ncbi:unnamed protein product [Boreogadus saida]
MGQYTLNYDDQHYHQDHYRYHQGEPQRPTRRMDYGQQHSIPSPSPSPGLISCREPSVDLGSDRTVIPSVELAEIDNELERKRKKLEEIENRIIRKKAAIALKKILPYLRKPEELSDNPLDDQKDLVESGLTTTNESSLKERVNSILQLRKSLGLPKMHSRDPKSSTTYGVGRQEDHPLKLRVKTLMDSRSRTLRENPSFPPPTATLDSRMRHAVDGPKTQLHPYPPTSRSQPESSPVYEPWPTEGGQTMQVEPYPPMESAKESPSQDPGPGPRPGLSAGFQHVQPHGRPRTPRPASPPPAPPQRPAIAPGMQRFLNLLNKGVDMDLFTSIVNDDGKSVPPDEVLPLNKPPRREPSRSGNDRAEPHPKDGPPSQSEPRSRGPWSTELPDTEGSPKERSHSANDYGRGISALISSIRHCPLSSASSCPRAEEENPVQLQLQNILKTLGLSLDKEEMSGLTSRTDERLNGKRKDNGQGFHNPSGSEMPFEPAPEPCGGTSTSAPPQSRPAGRPPPQHTKGEGIVEGRKRGRLSPCSQSVDGSSGDCGQRGRRTDGHKGRETDGCGDAGTDPTRDGEPSGASRAEKRQRRGRHGDPETYSRQEGDRHGDSETYRRRDGDRHGDSETYRRKDGDPETYRRKDGDRHGDPETYRRRDGDRHGNPETYSRQDGDRHGDPVTYRRQEGDRHGDPETYRRQEGDRHGDSETCRRQDGDHHGNPKTYSRQDEDRHGDPETYRRRDGDRHGDSETYRRRDGDRHGDPETYRRKDGDRHGDSETCRRQDGDHHGNPKTYGKRDHRGDRVKVSSRSPQARLANPDSNSALTLPGTTSTEYYQNANYHGNAINSSSHVNTLGDATPYPHLSASTGAHNPPYPLPGSASSYPLPGSASSYPLPGSASPYPLPGSASPYPLPGSASPYPLPGSASPYPLPGSASSYPLPGSASSYPPHYASSYPLPGSASSYPPPDSSSYPLPGSASSYPLPEKASPYPLPGSASSYPLPGSASSYPLPGSASSYPLPGSASSPATTTPRPKPTDGLPLEYILNPDLSKSEGQHWSAQRCLQVINVWPASKSRCLTVLKNTTWSAPTSPEMTTAGMQGEIHSSTWTEMKPALPQPAAAQLATKPPQRQERVTVQKQEVLAVQKQEVLTVQKKEVLGVQKQEVVVNQGSKQRKKPTEEEERKAVLKEKLLAFNQKMKQSPFMPAPVSSCTYSDLT